MTPMIHNTTPFAQQALLLADRDGQLFLSLVVGATFCFDAAGNAAPAPVQVAIPPGDVPFGQPGASSLRYDSAATGYKPAVDLVVVASAHAPEGKACGEMLVGLRVGQFVKMLSVCGDRQWSGALGDRPSPPQPFLVMPIRYERAYGGSIHAEDGRLLECLATNPVGVAYKGARCGDPAVTSQLPNIESPADRLVSPGSGVAVAGFGVVSRNWQPRAALAGTHDAQWLAQRWPLAPSDQDPRFVQCAPVDQQLPGAMEDEPVVLRNLTPDGTWSFRMPALDVPVVTLGTRGGRRGQIRTDTIIIDAEQRQVTLIGRFCIHPQPKSGAIREVILGEPSPGWLRAKARHKRYLGHSFPGQAR